MFFFPSATVSISECCCNNVIVQLQCFTPCDGATLLSIVLGVLMTDFCVKLEDHLCECLCSKRDTPKRLFKQYHVEHCLSNVNTGIFCFLLQ